MIKSLKIMFQYQAPLSKIIFHISKTFGARSLKKVSAKKRATSFSTKRHYEKGHLVNMCLDIIISKIEFYT